VKKKEMKKKEKKEKKNGIYRGLNFGLPGILFTLRSKIGSSTLEASYKHYGNTFSSSDKSSNWESWQSKEY
jgi:hypothetical protein